VKPSAPDPREKREGTKGNERDWNGRKEERWEEKTTTGWGREIGGGAREGYNLHP